jgi:single-strand DNA-binding protein
MAKTSSPRSSIIGAGRAESTDLLWTGFASTVPRSLWCCSIPSVFVVPTNGQGVHMETQRTSSHVSVIGRLGARHHTRELPSGMSLTSFTVIVDRAPEKRGRRGKDGRGTGSGCSGGRSAVTVDSIACVTSRVRVRDALVRWGPGTVVEIEGSLRRRFWRSGAGLGSAMDVDVRTMRRA